MALIDNSVRDLLTSFSSSDPTPGGGSAAALASAVGASLLLMVVGLPKTRTGSDEERATLTKAAAELAGIRAQLSDAIDADTAAYDQVVAAYTLPKASPDEQGVRKAAIQLALRAATEVPLGVMRLSVLALDQAKAIVASAHRAAASDVGVAVALLRAGARGARLNVEINIGGLADASYTSAITAEMTRWSDGAARAADAADALLRDA